MLFRVLVGSRCHAGDDVVNLDDADDDDDDEEDDDDVLDVVVVLFGVRLLLGNSPVYMCASSLSIVALFMSLIQMIFSALSIMSYANMAANTELRALNTNLCAGISDSSVGLESSGCDDGVDDGNLLGRLLLTRATSSSSSSCSPLLLVMRNKTSQCCWFCHIKPIWLIIKRR